jgi:hypothetical protein
MGTHFGDIYGNNTLWEKQRAKFGTLGGGGGIKGILGNYFVGLAYQGKDIVFKFIIEYSSLIRDFGPY